jgi:hypothetical protein
MPWREHVVPSRSQSVPFAFVVDEPKIVGHEPKGDVEGRDVVDVRRASDVQTRDVHVEPRRSHGVMSRSLVLGLQALFDNRRPVPVFEADRRSPTCFLPAGLPCVSAAGAAVEQAPAAVGNRSTCLAAAERRRGPSATTPGRGARDVAAAIGDRAAAAALPRSPAAAELVDRARAAVQPAAASVEGRAAPGSKARTGRGHARAGIGWPEASTVAVAGLGRRTRTAHQQTSAAVPPVAAFGVEGLAGCRNARVDPTRRAASARAARARAAAAAVLSGRAEPRIAWQAAQRRQAAALVALVAAGADGEVGTSLGRARVGTRPAPTVRARATARSRAAPAR